MTARTVRSSATGSTAGTSATDLQNTFLKLLVTQLKNQDPTNPMDSSQMTSQLAQISTVTGHQKLNNSAARCRRSCGEPEVAGSALIGTRCWCRATSSRPATGKARRSASSSADARQRSSVVVHNSAGLVNTIDLGKQPACIIRLTWTPTTRRATLPTATTRSPYGTTTAGPPRPPC